MEAELIKGLPSITKQNSLVQNTSPKHSVKSLKKPLAVLGTQKNIALIKKGGGQFGLDSPLLEIINSNRSSMLKATQGMLPKYDLAQNQ